MNDLIKWFIIDLNSKNWYDKLKEYKLKIESGKYDQDYLELKDEFEKYLDQFEWEKEKDTILKIQGESIKAYRYREVPEYVNSEDFFRSYCNIECRNYNEKIFYNAILKEHVYREDIDLVQKLVFGIKKELMSVKVFFEHDAKSLVSRINEKTSNFISPGLKERFDKKLLNFYEKEIENKDVPDVWDTFNKHWKENIKKQYDETDSEKSGDTSNEIQTDKPENPKSNKKSRTKGFILVNPDPDDQIFKNFHDSLKKSNFIEANFTEFKKGFFGHSGFEQIKWLGDQNELNYLIHHLIIRNKIKNYGAWIHTQNIFILKDGSSIHAEIRTNSYTGEHVSLNKVIGNL